jgi:transposase-like protein
VAAGRKIEDESEAHRFVAAARRSGISVGEWARAHGIDGRSLHAWAVNLGRRGATARRRAKQAMPPAAPARGLVEIVPVAVPGVMTPKARYVLDVVGARIEFGDDASVATLRRVLEALRSC